VTNYAPSSADFSKFLGPGTVTFAVAATAGLSVPNSSGNASGTSLTSAFPNVTVTYTYGIPIPEPSSMALLGLGAATLLLVRRFRRQAAAP
jgi:hypothetical protein